MGRAWATICPRRYPLYSSQQPKDSEDTESLGGNSSCRILRPTVYYCRLYGLDTVPIGLDVVPRGRDRRGGVLGGGRDNGNEDNGSARPPKMAAGRLVSFCPCRGRWSIGSRRNGAKAMCNLSEKTTIHVGGRSKEKDSGARH